MSELNDNEIVKIMSTLGLDYSPAIKSTEQLESALAKLNTQLKNVQSSATASETATNKNAGAKSKETQSIKMSTLAMMEAKTATMQQTISTKKLSEEYGKQAGYIRSGVAQLEKKLAVTGKLSVAEKKQTLQYKEQLAILEAQVKTDLADTGKQFNVIGSQFERKSSWFLSSMVFFGGVAAITKTVSSIKEIEKTMVDVKRVTQDETFNLKEMRGEVLQLGVDYGSVFEKTGTITETWARAGYNVADSLELTETTLLAVNAAEIKAETAAEKFIALMAQWGLTAEELLPTIDKINKTSDSFAITSENLIDGINRSGAAAKNAGMTLNDLIGVITTLKVASGRTGQEVGNAFNTMISYMTRSKTINLMEAAGIDVFADEAKTKFNNVMYLIDQLSEKWRAGALSDTQQTQLSTDAMGIMNQELADAIGLSDEYQSALEAQTKAEQGFTDVQERDLAQSAAGIRRRNYFISLMERFTETQKVSANMMETEGYTIEKNAIAMETLEKKYESLKASAEQLAVAIGDAGLLDVLKDTTDILKSTIQWFDSLDEGTKDYIITLTELILIMKGLKKLINMMGLSAVIAKIAKLNTTLTALTTKLSLSAPVITAISAAILALVLVIRKANKESEEARQQAIKNLKTQKEQITQTEQLINKYDELHSRYEQQVETGEDLTETKTDLLEVEEQLNGLYPDIVENTGKINELYSTQVDLLREKTEAAKEAYEEELKLRIAEGRDSKQSVVNELEALKTELKSNKEKLPNVEKDYYNKKAIADEAFTDLDLSHNSEAENRSMAYGATNKIYAKDEAYKEWEKTVNRNKELEKLIIEKENYLSDLDNMENELSELLNPTDPGYLPTPRGKGSTGGSTGTVVENTILAGVTDTSTLKSLLNAKLITYKEYYDRLNEIKENQYGYFKGMSNQELEAELASSDKSRASKAKEYLSLLADINSAKEKLNDLSEEGLELEEKSANQLKNAVNEIEHWSRIGVYSTKEQIELYKQLYNLQELTTEEQWSLQETIAGKYSDLLDEQLDQVKDIYEERMTLIEKTADTEITKQQDVIDTIDEQLKQLDRKSNKDSHYDKLADLEEQRRYHELRTGREHQEAIADIDKQVEEENTKWKLEQDKQALEDKKQTAEDEIDNIKQKLEEEKARYKDAYNEMLNQFNVYNINMISLSAGYDDYFYQDGLNKINAWKAGFASGDMGSFISQQMTGRQSANSKYYQYASEIVRLKGLWQEGFASGDNNLMAKAANDASKYYSKLPNDIANTLKNMNYTQAKDYLKTLPKFKQGGPISFTGPAWVDGSNISAETLFSARDSKTLLDYVKLTMPSVNSRLSLGNGTIDLSEINKRLDVLISIGKNFKSSNSYNFDKLVNAENVHFNDKTDMEIFSNEVKRTISLLNRI